MTDSNSNQTTGQEQVLHFSDDYEHLLSEIKQVPKDSLIPINIDVKVAITTAFGAWPAISSHKDQVLAEVPKFDVARFDNYLPYARALGHAHALYMTAIAPVGNLLPMAQRAAALREQLLSDTTALGKRNLINTDRLKDLSGTVGYRNVAFDLLALVALIRENWDKIAGKTAIDPAELEEADTLASTIVNEVGLREQSPAIVAETSEIRHQAFTLFVNNYDQIRRAISFIRWNEADLEDIAPSLYANRGNVKRKSGGDVQPPATPAPSPAATSSTVTPTQGSASSTPHNAAVATGLPGSPALTG